MPTVSDCLIFDGKALAGVKEEALKLRVLELKRKNINPKLVVILSGKNPDSELYVSLKQKFAQRVGVLFEIKRFDEFGPSAEIIEFIKKANMDASVHGIMVQLPVAEPFRAVSVIAPSKDVDCLTPQNLGLIMAEHPWFLPATVKAVISVIKSAQIKVTGANVTIVGASEIVGKPLAVLLSDAGATVSVCRSTTKDLSAFTKEADILISATGAPHLITKNMVKPGAAVIDVGISKLLRDGKFQVTGDVDSGVKEIASFFTPVPGGVGPVTVACLFENLLHAIV